MAFNPNAIFISPSTITDFEKCPQLYYYRSVYRTPRGLKIQLTNPSLALGGIVHDILSQFLNMEPAERNERELLRIFDFLWTGISGEKGGFSFAEEEKAYRERASQMLKRFWANPHFKTTLSVKIPSFPKVEMGNDIILTGKLDWIDKEEDFYHIVDFKTGKNEEKDDSIQLPIYAFLVSQLFKTDNIKASYWYLDKNEEIVSFTLPDLKETAEYLKKKGEIIKMARQTNSFRCQSGEETCWACREMYAVAHGEGKLVSMDPVNRKQEIYIFPKEGISKPEAVPISEELPF